MAGPVIAAIGSGGKTTALTLLARRLARQLDRGVLLTTTTHILPMEPPECRVCLIDPAPEELAEALNTPGVVCAGSSAKEGKLGMLAPEVLTAGLEAAGAVLYEADGSRRLPLKLHRPGEPVILPGTGLCLVLLGLSALGRPIGEVIQRYELDEGWRARPERPVGEDEVVRCALEYAVASGLPREKLRVFLNQVDTQTDPRPAVRIAGRLRDEGLMVEMGSLKES